MSNAAGSTSLRTPFQAQAQSLAQSAGGASNFTITRTLDAIGKSFIAGGQQAAKLGGEAIGKAAESLGSTLESVSQIAGGIGGILTAVIQGFGFLLDGIRGLVALADPSAESTLQGNLQLLAQTVGQELIPVVRAFSGLVAVTNAVLTYQIARLKEFIVVVAGITNVLGAGVAVAAALDALAKLGPQNIVTPVQTRISNDPTAFADRLQEAVLKADTNQTDTELLKKQLENLEASKQLLDKIEQGLAKQRGTQWGR